MNQQKDVGLASQTNPYGESSNIFGGFMARLSDGGLVIDFGSTTVDSQDLQVSSILIPFFTQLGYPEKEVRIVDNVGDEWLGDRVRLLVQSMPDGRITKTQLIEAVKPSRDDLNRLLRRKVLVRDRSIPAGEEHVYTLGQ